MPSAQNEGRGCQIGTASGRPYWPFDPRPEDIHWPDVVIHLSRICRYGGALHPGISGIYSVAQHSVLAHDAAPSELKLEALLHDAHEAFVGDMISPMKRDLPDYADLERLNELVLRKAAGLQKRKSPEVKEIDRRLYATEVRDLIAKPKPGLVWSCEAEPYPYTITPWVPGQARNAMALRMKEHGLL